MNTGPVDPFPPGLLTGLFVAGLAAYAVAWLSVFLRPRLAQTVVAAGVMAHGCGTIGRGIAIGYFPLTNKMESFSAAALAIAVVAVATWRPQRLYAAPLLGLAIISLGVSLNFPLELNYPVPLLRTVWYPLHVPLSFFAYGVWLAAACAGLVWFRGRQNEWLARVDRLVLVGFGLWSLAMICGGIWGVMAWGAYFLWDPKIIWSVILWFYYATFIHVRLAPSLVSRPGLRPALALVGFALVLVAFVGTSFFFGKSSHAFG